jgi:hypothetical protein
MVVVQEFAENYMRLQCRLSERILHIVINIAFVPEDMPVTYFHLWSLVIIRMWVVDMLHFVQPPLLLEHILRLWLRLSQ